MNKRLGLLLFCTVLVGGCFRPMIPVHSTWPVIPYPGRPAVHLPDELDTTNPQVEALIKSAYQYSRHIDVLEMTIDAYNSEAKKRNERVEELLFRRRFF